jgi:hypothetical protein
VSLGLGVAGYMPMFSSAAIPEEQRSPRPVIFMVLEAKEDEFAEVL